MLPYGRYLALNHRLLSNAIKTPILQTSSGFSTSLHRHGLLSQCGNKEPTIGSDLANLRFAPTPALSLGLAGLLPFVTSPFFMFNTGVFCDGCATGQVAYGAAILSFLGGVRWGMVVIPAGPVTPNWANYLYSVTPPLIAWSALLMPVVPGCVTCMAGLTMAGYFDIIQSGYPAWFRGLRILLTTVAVLALGATILVKASYPEVHSKPDELKKDSEVHKKEHEVAKKEAEAANKQQELDRKAEMKREEEKKH